MRHDVRQATLLALAMGVQLGSTGAARLQAYFGSPLFATAARIACIAVVAVLALGGLRGLLSRQSAVRGIVVSSLLQLACIATAGALDASARFALGVACTIAEGAGLALLMWLVLRGGTALGRRQAGIIVACGYLIVNVWDSFFVNASAAACTAQWVVGIVLVPVLMLAWARGERCDKTGGVPERDALPRGAGGTPSPTGLAAPALCVTLVLLATGVLANLTGVGGTGDNYFFDLSVNIYLVLVRLAVMAFVIAWPGRPGPVGAAALGAAGLALGASLTVILWDTDARFFGAMTVESALYVLQPLILVAGMEAARRMPAHATEVLLATIGVDFAHHVTRLLTPFFVDSLTSVSGHAVGCVAAVALGCVAVCAAAGWMREQAKGPATLDEPASAPTPDDPILARELAFYRAFCATAERTRLADREREVLYEAMHGYSADHIAERLAVSSQTVKTYLSRAYQKLGVRTKQEALRLLDETQEPQGDSSGKNAGDVPR